MALETLIQRSGGGLDAVDCLITPNLAGFNSLRFGQAEYLIEGGEAAAQQQLETILERAVRAASADCRRRLFPILLYRSLDESPAIS